MSEEDWGFGINSEEDWGDLGLSDGWEDL